MDLFSQKIKWFKLLTLFESIKSSFLLMRSMKNSHMKKNENTIDLQMLQPISPSLNLEVFQKCFVYQAGDLDGL